VETVGYDAAFTFIYSPRKGTRAADLPGQIPADVAGERIGRLIETVDVGTAAVHQMMIGQSENVLVESLSKRDGRQVSGKGTRGITITFEGSKNDIGRIIPVTITSSAANTLRAVRK
jgi:tRNA-2-methylthio-N6-dimethylallyladenosine synthase